MLTKMLTWARWVYGIGLALGVLFIIPAVWFPLQLGKLSLVALAMSIAAILFALSPEARGFLRGRTLHILLAVGLIPVAYLVSFWMSLDKSVGVLGYAVEADTILFVVLCYLVFALGFGLFRSMAASRLLLAGIVGATLVAGVFQFLVMLLGTSVLPAIFSDHSVNLVGKWNDLGILVGFVVALMLLAWEQQELSKKQRIILGVAGVSSLLLLAIIHFSLVWSLLLLWSIVVGVWSFVVSRGMEVKNTLSRVPWVPVGVALLSGVLLLWGAAVNSNLTSVFPVSALEVRPSFATTVDIIKASHGDSLQRFAVGTGPQTFGEQWLLHKPQSVNQSPFWNLDFNVGFSSFMTAVGTVGALGAIAWLIPGLLSILALVWAARRDSVSSRERFVTLSLALGAVYFWLCLLLYVQSQILILIAFALTGALCAVMFGARVDAAPTKKLRIASFAVCVGLVVLAGWITVAAGKRFLSETYVNQGVAALGQNHTDEALALAARAQSIEKTADSWRLGTDAGFAKLQTLGAIQHPSQEQVSTFLAFAQQTVPQGQAAIAAAPGDYRGYVSIGKVYDLLASLGISGAHDSAKTAYEQATARNPMNPQIPLLLARLEVPQNNVPGIQQHLARALTLKPDYTDAILFLVQLDVATNDIPSAITAAKAAIQSAPGVPSIWFELGLLYYSENNTAEAVPVLEQAIKIQPDYANAKYFLGLSYAVQGRSQDAIAQFADLQRTNPDNKEVGLILSNLQAGKPPFSGAQPPVTPTPQTRSSAPISQ